MNTILTIITKKVQRINKQYNYIMQQIENQNIINKFCSKFLGPPQTKQVSPTAQLIKDVVQESSAKYPTSWCEIVRKSGEEIVLENFRLEYFKNLRNKFCGVKHLNMSAGCNDFLWKFYSYNIDQGILRKNNFYL
jgi:hypothetical protein